MNIDREKEAKERLNKATRNFHRHHGVKVKMNTNYMLDAFTLKTEYGSYEKKIDYRHMVLLMETVIVDDVKHVKYEDFIRTRGEQLVDLAVKENDKSCEED